MDTTRSFETPEGVLLEMRVAGPVVRACAWAIDLALRAAFYLGLIIVLAYFGGVGVAAMLIGLFLLEWFYPVVFEVRNGATPGKRAMGIWVVRDNGTPVDWPSSLIRNLIRAADFFPVLYGVGLLSMLMNKDFKRLGDLAAGTLVIYAEASPARPELPPATPRRPPVELNNADQLALLHFAERLQGLSRDRAIEVAEILSGVSGERGPEAVDSLCAYASWLSKGR